MIVKVHTKDERSIAVVTDSELIGKKIEEGNKQLDFTSDFYKGEEMVEESVKALFKNVNHLHLSGKKSVGLAKSVGLVGTVITIGGVPHAQVVLVRE